MTAIPAPGKQKQADFHEAILINIASSRPACPSLPSPPKKGVSVQKVESHAAFDNIWGCVTLFLGARLEVKKRVGLTGLDPEVNRFLLNDGPGPREVGIADVV